MKSKKLISFLCAAALTVSSFAGLAVTASATAGDTLASQNFDGSTDNTWGAASREFDSTANSKGNKATYEAYTGQDAPTQVTGKSMHIVSKTNDNINTTNTIVPTVAEVANYEVDFDVQLASAYPAEDTVAGTKAESAYVFGFGESLGSWSSDGKSYSYDSKNMLAIKVLEDSIYVADGANFIDTDLDTTFAGSWYHVKAEAYTATKTYKITITPYANGATAVTKKNLGFVNANATKISTFALEPSKINNTRGQAKIWLDNFVVKESAGVETAKVTINYVDVDTDATIKSDEVDVEVGDDYTVPDSMKANFSADENNYYEYVSDGSTDHVTVTSNAASNVITLKFDKKPLAVLTVNAVTTKGQVIKKLYEKKTVPGTTEKYYNSLYIKEGSTWYKSKKTDNFLAVNKAITEDTVETVVYKEPGNVVSFTEAESYLDGEGKMNGSIEKAKLSGGYATLGGNYEGTTNTGVDSDAVTTAGKYDVSFYIDDSNPRGTYVVKVSADGSATTDILKDYSDSSVYTNTDTSYYIKGKTGLITIKGVDLAEGEKIRLYGSNGKSNMPWGDTNNTVKVPGRYDYLLLTQGEENKVDPEIAFDEETPYDKTNKHVNLEVTNADDYADNATVWVIHAKYNGTALDSLKAYKATLALQVDENDPDAVTIAGYATIAADDVVADGDKLMVWESLPSVKPLAAVHPITSKEADDIVLPTVTGAVSISGTAKVNETLTAVTTGLTVSDSTTPAYTYAWTIPDGAEGTTSLGTGATLNVPATAEGKVITLTVTVPAAYDATGATLTATTAAVAAADPVVTGQTVAVAQDFTGATVTVGSEAVAAGANKTNVAAATVITITPTENTKKVTSVTYSNGEEDVTTGVTLVDADGTATITVSNFDITIKSVVLADKAAAPTRTDVTAATAEITKNGTTLTASVKDVTPSDAASAFTTYAWSRSTTADGTYAPVAGLSNTLTAETGYFYKVAISIPASNETYNTYTATSDPVEVPVPTYTISGTVGTGVTAVAVTDGNDFNENATIEDGSYSITVPAGTYTITPTVNADLYEVSPASHTNVEVTDNNITGKNFTTLKKYPADAKPSITADSGAIKVGAALSANLAALNLGEAAETAIVTWYFKGTAQDAEFAAVPANDSKISEGKFTPDAEGTVKVKVEATGYVAGGVESDPATVGPNVNYVNVVITANGIASATLTNAADANKTYPASAGTGANADKLVAAVPVNATYNVTATPASNYAAPITYTGTIKSDGDEQIAVVENATEDVALTISATRVYAVTTETGTFADSVTAVPANTKVVFTPTAAVAGKKIAGVEVQDPANSDAKIADATAEGDGTYSYTVTNQAVKFTTIYADQTATVKVTDATLVGGTVTATANTGAEGAATAVTTEGIAVPVGKTITAKAVPAEGYKVASITIKTAATEDFTGDVTDTTNGATTTYDIIADDDAQTYTVTATFVKVDYTITNFTDDQTAPSTVKVTKVGETAYSGEEPTANSGDTVTIKVAAAAGKQLQANSLKVVAAGKTIGQDDYAGETLTPDPSDNTTYTFTMPAANVSIQAIFEAITHALTLPADETVTSDAADATKVAEGATVNLTITPPKGKKIKTLTVGDTEYEKADEAAATKYVTNASTGVSTTSFTMNDDTTVAVEYEVVYDTATVDPELLTYIVHSDAVKSNNLTDLTNEGSVDSDFTLKSAGNLQETTKTVMTGYQQSVFTSKYSSAGTFRTNSAAAYAVFDLADKVDDNVTKVTIKFDTESALAKGAGISAYFATQIDKWTAASTWTDINGVNANNAESIKVYAPSGNYAYGPSVGTAAANTTSQISFVIDNPALTLLKSYNNKLGIVLVANYDAGGLITLKNVVLEVESTDADMANYTVNAVDGEGNVLQEAIVTGTHAKNDEVEAIGLPKAVKYNDAYYVINETAEQAGFTTTFKMGDTDTTKTVEYTLDSTIKYYTEAENTGRLASSNWNPVKGYASGKASASYASSYLFVGAPAGATNGNTMETFAAGTYEFEVSVVDASHGRNVLLRNAASTSDDSILLTISGKGVKKETFTLTDATKLHITGKNAGTKTGQSDDIDYFIIREVTE